MELKTARRSGGRSRKSDRQSKKSIDQLEWGIPYNTDNFVEPLNEEGVNKIHNATMQVLEEIGKDRRPLHVQFTDLKHSLLVVDSMTLTNVNTPEDLDRESAFTK